MIDLAWVLLAYLLGSISGSILIVRLLAGYDIRRRGSRNAGASNVLRVVGFGPALAVLAVDVLKGWLPVRLAAGAETSGAVIGSVAVAAVFGHLFPIFHGWRGGKGVATATGTLGGLAWQPAGLAVLVFVVVVVTSRFVALGSLVAVVSFPLLLYGCGRVGWMVPAPTWLMASAVMIALLVVAKHHDNIRRLMQGKEHRLGAAEPEGKSA